MINIANGIDPTNREERERRNTQNQDSDIEQQAPADDPWFEEKPEGDDNQLVEGEEQKAVELADMTGAVLKQKSDEQVEFVDPNGPEYHNIIKQEQAELDQVAGAG